jgi:hypothetical protein
MDCTGTETEETDDTDNGNGGGGGGGSQWTNCTSFPYKKGCKSSDIEKAQECLGGLVVDGKFGRRTEGVLINKGYGDVLTQEVYDKIIANCGGAQTSTQQTEVNPYDNWEPNEPETGDASINKQETDTTEG